jgi:hypothetical protein
MPKFRDWVAGRTAITIDDNDELYVRDDSADESKRITWANVKTAIGAAGLYGPFKDGASATATSFSLVSGSPALNGSAGTPSWRLDASTIETVGARVPAHLFDGWTTMSISIRANVYSGSGDVVWRLDTAWIGDGDDVLALTARGNVTRTVAAANIEDVFEYLASTPVTAGKDLSVRVYRLGTDAADTLASDVAFVGLDFAKLT